MHILYMKFDMYVHTSISECSNLDVKDILTYAREFGLDGVCITDHQTMEISKQIKEGIQDNGLCVILGMEYTTADGDFLLFGPFEEIEADLPARYLLELVKQSNGVAVAAHPFRHSRPVSEFVFNDRLCTVVESINGRNSENENLMAKRWHQQYSLSLCGGSDARCIDELGKVITRFAFPVQNRLDLIYALKNNLCRPSAGISHEPKRCKSKTLRSERLTISC